MKPLTIAQLRAKLATFTAQQLPSFGLRIHRDAHTDFAATIPPRITAIKTGATKAAFRSRGLPSRLGITSAFEWTRPGAGGFDVAQLWVNLGRRPRVQARQVQQIRGGRIVVRTLKKGEEIGPPGQRPVTVPALRRFRAYRFRQIAQRAIDALARRIG